MASQIKYKPREETLWIILHDSHTPPDICATEDVPRWAALAHDQGLRMGLLTIGYHFIVERTAEIVECRPRHLMGSHTPGLNMDSIGICLVGGREEEGGDGVDNFTREQRRKTLGLCHELKLQFPTIRGVKSHSEVQRFRDKGHPSCPPIDMDLFREDLNLFAQGIFL